jgi:hypothetical protein
MLIEIIISSLIASGVHVAAKFDNYESFDEDPAMMRKAGRTNSMSLWWVRWYGSYLPKLLRKPLYQCLPCMGSLWSLPMFVYSEQPLIALPMFVLGVVGLNALIAYNCEL